MKFDVEVDDVHLAGFAPLLRWAADGGLAPSCVKTSIASSRGRVDDALDV